MFKKARCLILCILTLLALPACSKGPFPAERFGIETVISSCDEDGDGIDNYTDILLSARAYISTQPEYKSVYYAGGYPTDNHGVCTDVIWHALAGAGIDLKAMIDADIKQNTDEYPTIEKPDPNIDFRRVRNLDVFFKRYATSLTCDKSDIAEWQPGDIVVISPSHIAIVSDKRNRKGVPYIIHHSERGAVEADDLYFYTIIGHYRLKDGVEYVKWENS